MREQENAEVDLREANPKECGRDASSRRFARLSGGKAQRRGISEAMRGRKTVKEKLSSLLGLWPCRNETGPQRRGLEILPHTPCIYLSSLYVFMHVE